MYEVLIAILVFVIIYLLYVNGYKNQPALIDVPIPVTAATAQPQIIVVDTTPITPITTYSPWYEGNYVSWRRQRPYGYRAGWGRHRRHSA